MALGDFFQRVRLDVVVLRGLSLPGLHGLTELRLAIYSSSRL